MSRDLDDDLEAGARSRVFGFVVFVDLDFPSGNVRLHNGVGTYRIDGDPFLGVGALGSIDAMEESVELLPQPLKLILSSVDSDILTAVRTDNVYGRSALIYLGAIDEEGRLRGEPTLWVRAVMTKKEVIAGQSSAVSITVEPSSARFRRRNNKRYTLEDHQADYPGDKFFEFLPYVKDARIVWAGAPVRAGQRNTDDGLLPGGGRRRRRRDGPGRGNRR